MQTREEKLAYMKSYRENNKLKFLTYSQEYSDRKKKKTNKRLIRRCRQRVNLIKEEVAQYVKNMPVPFGTFEKAKYVCVLGGSVFYSFITTCRNTEECVLLLRGKASERRHMQPKELKIYKIQNRFKKLIVKEVL